jgi:hypothetical protein
MIEIQIDESQIRFIDDGGKGGERGTPYSGVYPTQAGGKTLLRTFSVPDQGRICYLYYYTIDGHRYGMCGHTEIS